MSVNHRERNVKSHKTIVYAAYGNSAAIITFDLWLGGFHTLAHHNERSPTPKRDSNEGPPKVGFPAVSTQASWLEGSWASSDTYYRSQWNIIIKVFWD